MPAALVACFRPSSRASPPVLHRCRRCRKFGRNQLSGPLPEAWAAAGAFANLEGLDLSDNLLTGEPSLTAAGASFANQSVKGELCPLWGSDQYSRWNSICRPPAAVGRIRLKCSPWLIQFTSAMRSFDLQEPKA
jgi:hypothetical protein